MTTKIVTIHQKINSLVTVNIFLLISKKIVIVDAGIKSSYKLVAEKLKVLGIDRDRVSLILLTHSHPDHCLGTSNMKKHFNVPVAISNAEAPYLQEGSFSPVVPQNHIGKMVLWLLRNLHKKHNNYVQPDIKFNTKLDLKTFGVSGEAILTPGHSVGGCSIVLDNGDCIVGDLIIKDIISKKPRINFFATDINMLKTSLRTVLTQKIRTIYTSHGNFWEINKNEKKISKIISG